MLTKSNKSRLCSVSGLSMTHQPPTGFLHFCVWSRKITPAWTFRTTSVTCCCIHMGYKTLHTPEATGVIRCTVIKRNVVIIVERSELPVIETADCVSCVARVSTCREPVLGCFAVHYERAVLGPVPLTTGQRLQVKSQLVLTVLGQLMQQFVAEPVIALLAPESDLKSFPRSIEVR